MSLTVVQAVKDLKGKLILEPNQDVLAWARAAVLPNEHLKRKAKIKDASQLVDDFSAIFSNPIYRSALEGWTLSFREWVGEIWVPAIALEELKLHKIRDPYAYNHALVVSLVGARMLELWVKAAPTVKRAFLAFLFHDIGKSRIAPTVLEKRGPLLDSERKLIHEHPIASFALNATYWGDANNLCAEVSLHHHEDRLGAGYPQGLKTNSLILDILGTLDRFDALINERPFREEKFSQRDAFDLLKKDSDGGRMEPDVLKALVALIRREKISELKKITLGTIGREPKVEA